MGATTFAFTDPRAQKVWSKDLFQTALGLCRLRPLMGKTQDDAIRVNQDLTRQKGGDVLFEALNHLSGAGVGDDGNTENNAQALTYRNQTVRVHTRATRSESAGSQSMQLTTLGPDNFRQVSKTELATWIAEIVEIDQLTALYGGYNENASSADIETVNEVYPSSTRILYLGQSVGSTPALDNTGVGYATDALLSAATQASNLFGTLVIQRAKRMAIMASPRMRPCIYRQTPASQEKSTAFPVQQGPLVGNMYLCFISPYQTEAVKSELGTNGWSLVQQAAAQRGNDHPIFTGASFLWDGVIVSEWERIPYRTGAGGTTLAEGFLLNAGRTATDDPVANGRSVARALFLGANAGLFAWAMPFGWWEGYEDGNKPFVKTEGIYGTKVSQFNAHGGSSAGAEEARICLDTQIII